ncbi:MAG TPA: tetratricopeptide repeat protein [Bryobacteraceae bacterium]|nr:tetratricopeptide repeat protein [Bryobacteraceae bacterium]
MKFGLYLPVILLAVLPLRAANYETCRALEHHGQLKQAQACYTTLVSRRDAFSRAEGEWGLHRYDDANAEFRTAYKQQPQSALVRVEWGKLFLERFNAQDAMNLFSEALELDRNYAPAYLAMARVMALGYDKKAVDLANEAIAHDPKLFEAHEFLAYLALEDGDTAKATKEAQAALSTSSEALQGLAVLASIDFLNDKPSSPWMDKALQVNPVYGEGYFIAAHFFVINRRYDEGIEFYRKALALRPELWKARSELGMNLLRVGKVDEARGELKQAYDAGFKNAETVNALRVIDSLRNFDTINSGNTTLVLAKGEAALVEPYIQDQLNESIAIYQRKYKMTLPGPVRLEVYPNHEDFIVRTLGLPGQGGLLGVTFGLVVAMDSPSAREPGQFNWAATIRHELSHVFVVTATHNRVPRWFGEGLAVHEESATNPRWGDRMTPDIVTALQQKKLLPVMELERGFIRPTFPGQVSVSYYEAGKMCDYISERWGESKLLDMVHSFGDRKTTEQVIRENLQESPAQFDKDFLAWLDKQTADTVQHFDEWKKQVQTANADLAAGKKDEAIQKATSAINVYRDYVGDGSLYEVLAKAYLTKGDNAAAIANLELYRDRGGRNLSTLKQLADLEARGGQPRKAIDTYRGILDLYLEDASVHQKLGTLDLDSGHPHQAVREFRAVIAMKPSDPAQAHYDLAKALYAAKRPGDARDEILLSLEAAPDFKPAQRLLLQLPQ